MGERSLPFRCLTESIMTSSRAGISERLALTASFTLALTMIPTCINLAVLTWFRGRVWSWLFFMLCELDGKLISILLQFLLTVVHSRCQRYSRPRLQQRSSRQRRSPTQCSTCSSPWPHQSTKCQWSRRHTSAITEF
jgi:hypothetical protein